MEGGLATFLIALRVVTLNICQGFRKPALPELIAPGGTVWPIFVLNVLGDREYMLVLFCFF